MPKEINWNQFEELNEKQRKEFEEFVNKYGQIIEDTLGILIDDAFVGRKLKENGETYQKSSVLTNYRNSREELNKTVKPEIPGGMEGISRGFTYYLTDDPEENKALADSLSTKEGRQALFHRMVNDLMDTDLNTLFEKDTNAALDRVAEDPKKVELLFITENVNMLLKAKNTEFSLEEPMKTAFMEKVNLLETLNNNREKAIFGGSPIGVLLGGENMKEKLGDQLEPKMGEFYTQMISVAHGDKSVVDPLNLFLQEWQMPPSRKPFETMQEKGWLNDNVHILDDAGNIQNKRNVYRALEDGSKKPENYQVRESTPEEMEQLREQREALPTYRSKSEFIKTLRKSGLPDMEIANYKPATAQKDFMVVIPGQNSLFKLTMNEDTGRFQLGEAVSEPVPPKRPNLFKRIMHGISKNLFKKDFDDFDKATTKYNETVECLSKKDKLQEKLALRNESTQQKAEREQRREQAARQERVEQMEEAIFNMSRYAASNMFKDNKETVFGKYATSEGLTAMESVREYILGNKPIQGNEAEIRKNLAKITTMQLLRREFKNSNIPQTMTGEMEKFMNPKNKGKVADPVETLMQHPGFQLATQDGKLNPNTIMDIVTKYGEPVFNQIQKKANQMLQKENIKGKSVSKSQDVPRREPGLGKNG